MTKDDEMTTEINSVAEWESKRREELYRCKRKRGRGRDKKKRQGKQDGRW